MAIGSKLGMSNAEIAQLIASLGAGALGGASQSKQNALSQSQIQKQQLDQNVQRILSTLQNSQQTGQNLQTNRQQMPINQADRSPLGQEQTFLQRQRLMQTMLPEMAKFNVGGPTDPGIQGAYKAPTNMLAGLANPKLQEAYGDQATATSLADRRKLMAQINPDYQFSSLGQFGLDPSFDQGVNQASQQSGARLKAYEDTQSSLANQQVQLANQAQTANQNQNQNSSKGGGVGGFVGGLLKKAAPFAALIPGVGPVASIAMAGGASVLGDKLQGNSFGHALGAGALGAAGAGLAEGLQSLSSGQGFNPFNNGSGPALNNAMTSASFPVSQGIPQGTQLNLPSTSVGGFSPFAGGASQQAPGLGGSRMQSVMSGTMAPKQFPSSAQPNSGLGPWAAQPPYIGQNPIGDAASKATGIGAGTPMGMLDYMKQTFGQQPAVRVAQSPQGGLMLGSSIGSLANAASRTAGMAAANAPGALQDAAMAGMNANRATGVANRANQFNNTWQAGVNAPNMNTGLNAKSILEVLSGNSLNPQQKAQFLARPEVQAIFKSLTGGR